MIFGLICSLRTLFCYSFCPSVRINICYLPSCRRVPRHRTMCTARRYCHARKPLLKTKVVDQKPSVKTRSGFEIKVFYFFRSTFIPHLGQTVRQIFGENLHILQRFWIWICCYHTGCNHDCNQREYICLIDDDR